MEQKSVGKLVYRRQHLNDRCIDRKSTKASAYSMHFKLDIWIQILILCYLKSEHSSELNSLSFMKTISITYMHIMHYCVMEIKIKVSNAVVHFFQLVVLKISLLLHLHFKSKLICFSFCVKKTIN